MGSGFSGAFFLSSSFIKNNFMGLVLAVLGLGGCMDFFSLQGSGPPSLVAMCRLLIAMASLVEHGL